MPLTLKVHVIEGRGVPGRVLLQIHGYWSGQLQMSTLGPIIDPGAHYLVVSPRGPKTVGVEDAYWYERDASGVDVDSFVEALDAIDTVLDNVCDAQGFRREEAVVSGFSQGGTLALALAVRASTKPRPDGVILWSTYLPEIPGLDWDWERAVDLPVLVQHGRNDPMVPLDRGLGLARALAGSGASVSWHEYDMGHDVSVESLGDARDWLTGLYDGTPIVSPPA